MRTAPLAAFVILAASHAVAQVQAKPQAPTLTGRVVDESGKGMAGVAVDAFAGEFVDTVALLTHPRCVTAADGSYALPWRDIGPCWLILAAAGRQSCAVPIPDPSAQPAVPEFVLVPGARLQGRVRDEAGTPLPNARVRVESGIPDRDGHGHPFAGAVTDGKGIFVVPGVPADGLRVTVEAVGYLSTARLAAHDSPLDVSLHAVGMVRGKVVDAAGAPVAGVVVRPITIEQHVGPGATDSAADGTFALTVPSRGRFRLEGTARCAPYRHFTSGILHGAADDVTLIQIEEDLPTIQVRVVDAASRQPLPQYWLSEHQATTIRPQSLMFSHSLARRPCSGSTTVRAAKAGASLILIADAPGHAFEIAPVPDRLDHPFEIALGPEAVLVGKVTDAETGKPLAGVAVRALPSGNGTGSGGRPEEAGPLSDAQGNYRIGSLQAGSYSVQAHARGRPNSGIFHAHAEVGTETRLDFTVPRENWLEGELTGAIPPGPGLLLSASAAIDSDPGTGYGHNLTPGSTLSFTRTGRFRFGPVDESRYELQVFLPSRTRAGTGTTILLGPVPANRPETRIDLSAVARHVLRGKVELAPGVPSERIAVVATPPEDQRSMRSLLRRHTVAGVASDGAFTMDLPVGHYCLQLADVRTGILFHTEAVDLTVEQDTGAVLLQPTFHWLEIACEPKEPGGAVVLTVFGVHLPRPRYLHDALLDWSGGNNGLQCKSVGFADGDATQRWLVPSGRIELEAWQHASVLMPGAPSSTRPVAQAAVQIEQAEQRVVLQIPSPPSDEELPRRKN